MISKKENLNGLKLTCDHVGCLPRRSYIPRRDVGTEYVLRLLAENQGWLSQKSPLQPTLTNDYCPNCKDKAYQPRKKEG